MLLAVGVVDITKLQKTKEPKNAEVEVEDITKLQRTKEPKNARKK
jgi:hypothetical protein